MIYLLGGSGYVWRAYQELLTEREIPFRNLRRAEIDYTDVRTLTAALEADRPEFLINAAGYTGKPNVDACELDKANCILDSQKLASVGIEMTPVHEAIQRALANWEPENTKP